MMNVKQTSLEMYSSFELRTLFVNCFAFRKQVELEIIHLFPMEV